MINKGPGCIGKYGETIINWNGVKMVEFSCMNELLIDITFWYQRKEDRYTCESRRNRQSLVNIWQEIKNLKMIINLNKIKYMVINQKKQHTYQEYRIY